MEHETTEKIKQFGKHYVKLDLMRHRLDFFSNDSAAKGIDFVVKTVSGKYHDISVQVVNLERDKGVKIEKILHKRELRDNLWFALVLLMKDIEPALYMIPSKVFEKPDDYIFVDNEQGEKFSQFSNWEIKVFTKAIPKLHQYALKEMVSHFK
jgi:hypothetical protein